MRRRQYLATERNAVRLQQTLRILAETAEVPEQVRAETSARSVVEQQRALRRAAEEAEAAARARDAAAARALPRVTAKTAASPTAAVRLRRARLTTTMILALSLAGIVAGLVQVVAGAPWTLIVVSSIAAMLSVVALQRMSQVAQARRIAQVPVRTVVRSGFTDFAEQQSPVAPAREVAPWTPVPVPKPLYLSRTSAAPSSASASAIRARAAAQELREAAADADRALRDAHEEPEVATLSPRAADADSATGSTAGTVAPVAPVVAAVPVAPAAPPSRFARMGIIEDAEPGMADLDAVLRRRRAAG